MFDSLIEVLISWWFNLILFILILILSSRLPSFMSAWWFTLIYFIIVARLFYLRFIAKCSSPGSAPPIFSSWPLPSYIPTVMLKMITDLPKYIDAEDVKFLQNSRENVINKIIDEISKIDKSRLEKYNAKLDAWKSKNGEYAPCIQAQAEMKKASSMEARVSSIYTVFRSTANHLGPWFALLMILVMIVLLMSYFTSKSRKPINEMKFYREGQLSEQVSRLQAWLEYYIPPEMNPFKAIKKLSSRVTFKNNIDGIDRPKVTGGRCGNTWIDAGDTCLNTQNPEPYKTGITEDNQDVYMPWLVQGTFFVPQCEETFIKDDGTGNPKMTDTIYFNDLGLRCSSDNRVRPKDKNKTTSSSTSAATATNLDASKSSENDNANAYRQLNSSSDANRIGSFVLVSGQ